MLKYKFFIKVKYFYSLIQFLGCKFLAEIYNLSITEFISPKLYMMSVSIYIFLFLKYILSVVQTGMQYTMKIHNTNNILNKSLTHCIFFSRSGKWRRKNCMMRIRQDEQRKQKHLTLNVKFGSIVILF